MKSSQWNLIATAAVVLILLHTCMIQLAEGTYVLGLAKFVIIQALVSENIHTICLCYLPVVRTIIKLYR